MAKANADEKAYQRNVFRFWAGKFLSNGVSILPVVAVVSALFFIGFLPGFNMESSLQVYVGFLICAVFVGVGLTLFTTGAEQSMTRIGTIVGQTLFKKRKLWLIIMMTFLLGFLITIAEPDLKVMARQIGWDETLLIVMVGIGVAVFLVVGVLRILFNKDLNIMFICFYGIVFMFAGIVNPKFLPICFDSGGVTTGPVTVPFILAFGAGLAASRSSAKAGQDGSADAFGLTALASVGPIIAVMIMSLFADADSLTYTWETSALMDVHDWATFWPTFGLGIGNIVLAELKEVAIAIGPLVIFFIVYELIFVRLSFRQLLTIFVGLVYAYLGLVIFLSVVQMGFLPIAQQIGFSLGTDNSFFIYAIIIAALFGIFGVLAEPAVHVLVHQIESVSEGVIKSRTVLAVMALSIGGGVALAVVRAKFGFSILYYMIPGYLLAFGLSFIVPRIYTSIAFDSGGVASGPMASTFVMPLVIGFTYSANGADEVFASAFGCVSMIALMPLIVIQLMGFAAGAKRAINYARVRREFVEPNDNQIIHFVED